MSWLSIVGGIVMALLPLLVWWVKRKISGKEAEEKRRAEFAESVASRRGQVRDSQTGGAPSREALNRRLRASREEIAAALDNRISLNERRVYAPLMQVPAFIVIHCTDSADGKDYSAASIDADHRARGFSGGIGYHYVFQPSGLEEKGRHPDVVGAGVKGANVGAVHLSLVGREKFTKKQLQACASRVKALRDTYGEMKVYLHNEFPSAKEQGKTCPNIDKKVLIEFLKKGTIPDSILLK